MPPPKSSRWTNSAFSAMCIVDRESSQLRQETDNLLYCSKLSAPAPGHRRKNCYAQSECSSHQESHHAHIGLANYTWALAGLCFVRDQLSMVEIRCDSPLAECPMGSFCTF